MQSIHVHSPLKWIEWTTVKAVQPWSGSTALCCGLSGRYIDRFTVDSIDMWLVIEILVNNAVERSLLLATVLPVDHH